MQDMIDFPCSDEWLRYYQLQGLTFHAPTELSPSITVSDTGELAEVSRLKTANERLRQELTHLQTIFNQRIQARLPREKDAKPSPPQKAKGISGL